MARLTQKQETFCLEYVKTGNASEAYRKAYNAKKMKDETVNNKAYNLLKKGEIRARVDELRKKAEDDAIMDAKERKKFLTKIILGDNEVSDKLKAIDLLNKMEGSYTQKVEHSGITPVEIVIK